jgi:hypothetical protein
MNQRLLMLVVFAVPLLQGPALALVPAPHHEWSAASAQDILAALGNDSDGLALSSDKLPDLFELTASRIEEDSKKFLVEQPYTAGRWRGGKVVIEYARDLSYTLVSVYDKHGRRQRIYSVRTKPKDAKVIAQDKARFQQIVQAIDVPGTPQPMAVDTAEPESVPPDETPAASPEKPAAPSEKSARAHEPRSSSKGKRHHRKSREEAVVAAAPVVAASPVVATAKVTPPVPSLAAPPKEKIQKEADAVEQAAVEPGAAYEWDEQQGAYVPVKSGRPSGHAAAAALAPARAAAQPAPAPPPGPPVKTSKKDRKRHTRHEKVESTPSASPATALHPSASSTGSDVSSKNSDSDSSVWMPGTAQTGTASPAAVSTAAKSKSGAESVPSTEELLAAPDAAETPPPAASSSKRSKSKHSAAAESASVETYVPPPPPEPEPVPVVTMTPSEKAAAEAVKHAKELEEEAKRHPASKRAPAPVLAKTNAAAAPEEAQTPLDSDKWKPGNKKPAPAVDPDIPQVAMIPKPVSREVQLDNMIHAAQDGKTVTADGDAWTPKKAPAIPKPDLETQAEIAQVRAQKPAPVVQVKVKRDINNPEEGVMPVNEFEKFAGGRYGRHREYERRFYYGQRPKAPVKNYDFYIDEVDRKKEIHNVYYYKKGKAPQLMAVERHTRVTFLSNYDVEKEDKGKVTTY